MSCAGEVGCAANTGVDGGIAKVVRPRRDDVILVECHWRGVVAADGDSGEEADWPVLLCESVAIGTAVWDETLDGAGETARGVGAPELPETELSKFCSWLGPGLGGSND